MRNTEGAVNRRNMLLVMLALPCARARTPIFPDLASDVAAWDAARLSDRWVDWCATRPTHSLPPRAARSAE